MPGRLVAPGPGRSARRLNVPLLVAGMQKTVASLAACGMPSVRSPAGMPVSVMHLVPPWPKAPGFVWLGQKLPVALVTLTLPVVRGFRSTLNAPAKNPMPSSGGQSWLVLPVAGFPVVAVVEQAPPALGPALLPIAGASARAVRAGETHGAGVRAAAAGPRVHTFARRARPLGAVELAGPVAGDELTGTAYVEVGGGSGRGGAGRDRVGTAAADVQTGGTKIESLYRAGGVGVDRARERHGRGAREARPATTRRAGSRRVLEREARRCAGGAGRARCRAARRRGRRPGARRRGRRPGARRRGR